MSKLELNSIYQAIQFFDLKVVHIDSVPESNSSEVRILTLANGEKVVLKLSYNQRKFNREQFALHALRAHAFTPNLLATYETEHIQALLLEYKDGLPITHPTTVNSYMAAQLGEAMAIIHQTPMQDFEGYGNWKEFLLYKTGLYIHNCRHFDPEFEWDEVEHVLTYSINQVIKDALPCLIHFDLRLGNILHKDEKMVAIIDFESAKGGSGDMDFLKIWRELWRLRPELREPLMSAYQAIRKPEAELTLVIPLYYLYHCIAGMNWCIERKKVNNPFYFENRAGMKDALEMLHPFVKG